MRWGDSIANTINNQSHIAQYKELSKNYNAFLQESQGAIAATRTFPNIVLIIGESTQKNYMSLYNYPPHQNYKSYKKAVILSSLAM